MTKEAQNAILGTCAQLLINSVALAQCKEVFSNNKLFQFQQFVLEHGKLLKLKWFSSYSVPLHRPKATVLMAGSARNETLRLIMLGFRPSPF